MPFGGEDGLLAVDEEVALTAGCERDAATLETQLTKQIDQARAFRRVEHAPNLVTTQSWLFFFFALVPLLSTGTTGGGGRRGSGLIGRTGVNSAEGGAAGATRGGSGLRTSRLGGGIFGAGSGAFASVRTGVGAGSGAGTGAFGSTLCGSGFASTRACGGGDSGAGATRTGGLSGRATTAAGRAAAAGAGSPSVCTCPRAKAPGAMPTRGPEISPATRAPGSSSTACVPRKSPCTWPEIDNCAPLTLPRTRPWGPITTLPVTLTSPSTRPKISSEPWPRTCPLTTVPTPITEVSVIRLKSPCRRCP